MVGALKGGEMGKSEVEKREEDRMKLMAILDGEDIARRRYLGEPSVKDAMEKSINWQLEMKSAIVKNPDASDAAFFDAMKDIALLNKMKDDLHK